MLIEKIIFSVCAFTLFILMILRTLKNKDKNYLVFIAFQGIGILIRLINIVFKINENNIIQSICYLFSIIFPIIIFICEKKKINPSEIVAIIKFYIYKAFKNSKAAKNVMLDLSSKYHNSAIAHKLLAEIYEKEGGMRKAIDEYVQAMDINKRDYNSYYKIAYLLSNLDKKDESIEMLINLLNKKNDHMEAAILLGELLIEKEEYKEAANVYYEALKFHPESYELNYNLAIAYTMLNDFQNAKACYEIAAQINSLSYNSKYSLAEIALIYKELEEAETYFTEILENKKMEAEAYYQLAKISLIKGSKEMAITYANLAIESNAKKIVPKIKNDTDFIPILSKVAIPFNIIEDYEEQSEKNINDKREEMVHEHLEQMVEITKNLSYNDINMLKRKKQEKSEKTINEDKNLPYKER